METTPAQNLGVSRGSLADGPGLTMPVLFKWGPCLLTLEF